MNEKEKLITQLLKKIMAEAEKRQGQYWHNRDIKIGEKGYYYAPISISLANGMDYRTILCDLHESDKFIEIFDGANRHFILKEDITALSVESAAQEERGER